MAQQTPYQTRTSDTPCPRCGTPLRVREAGIMVDELPEPVKWTTVERRCPKGCQITADDFS
ncbi:MAG: hypothetical protein WKF86_06650 [Acidimicrobiales bacterium]